MGVLDEVLTEVATEASATPALAGVGAPASEPTTPPKRGVLEDVLAEVASEQTTPLGRAARTVARAPKAVAGWPVSPTPPEPRTGPPFPEWTVPPPMASFHRRPGAAESPGLTPILPATSTPMAPFQPLPEKPVDLAAGLRLPQPHVTIPTAAPIAGVTEDVPEPPPGLPSGGPLLTPEQARQVETGTVPAAPDLAAILRQRQDIGQRADALAGARTSLEAASARRQAEVKELEAERSRLTTENEAIAALDRQLLRDSVLAKTQGGFADRASLDAFRQRVAERDERAKALRASVDTHRTRVQAFNASPFGGQVADYEQQARTLGEQAKATETPQRVDLSGLGRDVDLARLGLRVEHEAGGPPQGRLTSPLVAPLPAEGPSLMQRLTGTRPEVAAERRAQQDESSRAYLEGLAQQTGIPVEELERRARGALERPTARLTRGLIDSWSFGLVPSVLKALGLEPPAPPEERSVVAPPDALGSVLQGAGHLAGFLTNPIRFGRAATERLFGEALASAVTDQFTARLVKAITTEAATLASASAAEATGQALGQTSLLDAAKVYGQAAKSGTLLGTVFGAARGALPADTLLQRSARIGLGMTALDAAEGRHPLDERSFAQKAFDYGLNAFFLFHGQDVRRVLDEIRQTAREQDITEDEAFQRVVADFAKAKVGERAWERIRGTYARQQGLTGEALDLAVTRYILGATELGPRLRQQYADRERAYRAQGLSPEEAKDEALVDLAGTEFGTAATPPTPESPREGPPEPSLSPPSPSPAVPLPPEAPARPGKPATPSGPRVGLTSEEVADLKRIVSQDRAERAGGPVPEGPPQVAESTEPPSPKAAPVTFRGWQTRGATAPPLALWDLTEDVPGHPKGSTVSAKTLTDLGYTVPESPEPAPTSERPQSPMAEIPLLARATLDDLVAHLGSLGVQEVYQFGSTVKGQARPSSDVDLFVVAPDTVQAELDRRYWVARPTVIVNGVARKAEIHTARLTGTNDPAIFRQMQPEARRIGPMAVGPLRPEPSGTPPLAAVPPPVPAPPEAVARAIQDGVARYREEGDRGLDWTFHRVMTPAIRAQFGQYLVALGHPLAQEAMTADERFRRFIREQAERPSPETPSAQELPASAPETQGGAEERPPAFTLPPDLAGAKPRFGFGAKNYTLDFASDLDRALFIVSQPTPSKRDADYLAALRGVYGEGKDATIRELGQAVRARVKVLVAGKSDAQPIAIPGITRVPKVAPAAPAVSAAPGGTALSPDPHDYSSTQIELPTELANRIVRWAREHIDPEDLAEDGIEQHGHVTVLYGLQTADRADVERVVADAGLVSVSLDRLQAFTHAGEPDVLYIAAASPDLYRLNEALASGLENTQTHPKYRPYATVAYLRPGTAQKYAGQRIPGVTGESFAADRLSFMPKEGEPASIALSASAPKSAPRASRADLIARYQAGNPFAKRAAVARETYERFVQPTARDTALEQSFPLGTGYGRKGGEKRIEQTIDRAVEAERARKNAEYYEAQATAFDRGEINAQGRAVSEASRQRSEARQSAAERREARIQAAKEARGDKPAWQVPASVWADSSGYLGGSARDLVLSGHREAVEEALRKGEPVPAEVIAEYPDLTEPGTVAPETASPTSPMPQSASEETPAPAPPDTAAVVPASKPTTPMTPAEMDRLFVVNGAAYQLRDEFVSPETQALLDNYQTATRRGIADQAKFYAKEYEKARQRDINLALEKIRAEANAPKPGETPQEAFERGASRYPDSRDFLATWEGLRAALEARGVKDTFERVRNRWDVPLPSANEGLEGVVRGMDAQLSAWIARATRSYALERIEKAQLPRLDGVKRADWAKRAEELEKSLTRDRPGDIGKDLADVRGEAAMWEARARDIETLRGEPTRASEAAHARAERMRDAADKHEAYVRSEIEFANKEAQPPDLTAVRERLANPSEADRLAATLVTSLSHNQLATFTRSPHSDKLGAEIQRALGQASPDVIRDAADILLSEDGVTIPYEARSAPLRPADLDRQPTRDNARAMSATVGDQPAWSNGHFIEVGAPPKGIEVSDKADMAKAFARVLADAGKGTARLTPVARVYSGAAKTAPELVYFRRSDGALGAANARYWDHFTSRHPSAVAVQGKDVLNVIGFKEGDTVVGALMPFRVGDEAPVAVQVLAGGEKPTVAREETAPYGEADEGQADLFAVQALGEEPPDLVQESRARYGVQDTEPEPALAPPFFLASERILEQKMPAAAFPAQVKGLLRAGGVKEDEIKWSGIEAWLDAQGGRKVSKAEVLDYLRENNVQVDEVVHEQRRAPGDGVQRERVHSFPITPEIRRSVLSEGVSLFQPGAGYTESRGLQRRLALPEARTQALARLRAIDQAVPAPRGTVARAGGRPGEPATRTLGHAFLRELAERGSADLRGQLAPTPEDLAVLAQVFRDPAIETHRYIFVDADGTILDHEGATANLPGASPIYLSQAPGETPRQATDRTLAYVRGRMRALGATGVWSLHNHPTGDPTPSTGPRSDEGVAKRLAEEVRGFRGMVVIDSGTYGVIEPGQPPRVEALPGRTPFDAEERLLVPSVPHPLLGHPILNPKDIAALGVDVHHEPGWAVALYRAGKEGRIRGLQDVRVADLVALPESERSRWLLEQKRRFGSPDVFLYTPAEDPALRQALQPLLVDGRLMDYVTGLGDSHRPEHVPFGLPRDEETVSRVREEEDGYGRAALPRTGTPDVDYGGPYPDARRQPPEPAGSAIGPAAGPAGRLRSGGDVRGGSGSLRAPEGAVPATAPLPDSELGGGRPEPGGLQSRGPESRLGSVTPAPFALQRDARGREANLEQRYATARANPISIPGTSVPLLRLEPAVPDALIDGIAQAPYLGRFAEALQRAVTWFGRALAERDSRYGDVVLDGLGAAPDPLGFMAVDTKRIVVNPHAHVERVVDQFGALPADEMAEEIAGEVLRTVVHEIAHQTHAHGPEFEPLVDTLRSVVRRIEPLLREEIRAILAEDGYGHLNQFVAHADALRTAIPRTGSPGMGDEGVVLRLRDAERRRALSARGETGPQTGGSGRLRSQNDVRAGDRSLRAGEGAPPGIGGVPRSAVGRSRPSDAGAPDRIEPFALQRDAQGRATLPADAAAKLAADLQAQGQEVEVRPLNRVLRQVWARPLTQAPEAPVPEGPPQVAESTEPPTPPAVLPGMAPAPPPEPPAPPAPPIGEAGPGTADRFPREATRETLERLTAEAARMAPPDRQALAEWVRTQEEALEREGRELADWCLENGARFTIQ